MAAVRQLDPEVLARTEVDFFALEVEDDEQGALRDFADSICACGERSRSSVTASSEARPAKAAPATKASW